MSPFTIEEQLKTIKKVSQKVSQTEQSALTFLKEAGLVAPSHNVQVIKASPKK